MDELVGAFFFFGIPLALWFGYLWIAKAVTGKSAPQRAYDIQVKRARNQRMMGELQGRIIRDAMED